MGWKMNEVLGGGKYLRAVDCDPPILVTMSAVTQEEVGQDREHKYALWFSEVEMGLILNKINGDTISQIVGTDDSDSWNGHQIVLFKTQTDYAGKRVDCIRVRAPKKAPVRATAKPVDPRAEMAAMQQQEEPFDDADVPF